MKSEQFRKVIWSLAAVVSAAMLWIWMGRIPVPRVIYLTGWSLLALMLLLAGYNLRKRLTFLPLGSSTLWLEIHIYVGLLTVLLFGMHVQWRLPRGWFEGAFATLYVLVMVSGLIGLALTRALPKRLTSRGGEVIFERIPEIRLALQREAETVALHAARESQSSVLAHFYSEHLRTFLDRPCNFWLHLAELRRPLNQMLFALEDLDRYLSDPERKAAERLAHLVRQKDGLDYHRALQLTLKAWLFVHIPFTYSLLLFALVHVVVIMAFGPGAR
jgi:hypothetical protein